MTDTIKPGWKTTEFWMSGLVALVGVAVAGGWITPEQAATINESAVTVQEVGTNAYAQITGAIMAVLPILGYNAARAKAKSVG